MTYELCAPETVSIEPKTGDTRVANLRERMEHAKTLGLTAQAAFLEKELRHGEKKPKELNPLTADEVTVWKQWLPTCYRDDLFWLDDRAMRKMSSYMFDRVPSPVLKLWTGLKKQDVFDYYEIWTPEKQKTDPILVGVLGNERYLLARWGESDANFLNFEDIAKKLWARRSEANWLIDIESVYVGVILSRFAIIATAVILPLLAWKAIVGEFGIDGGAVGVMAGVCIILSTIGATWFRLTGKKGERSFINCIFAVGPEKEFSFGHTEYLRAICRIYGKAPQSK